MSIDIENLEALARAASKGPWYVREMGDDCFVEAPGSPDMAFRLDVCGDDYTGHGDEEQRRHNMEHIAAADPDAILALVARLREAEAREQALEAHVERLGKLWVPLSSDIASLFDQQPQNMDDGSYLVDGQSAHEFAMALNDAPATSLICRDAGIRADGIEIAMEDPDMPENVRKRLAALRDFGRHMARQAEQADTTGEES